MAAHVHLGYNAIRMKAIRNSLPRLETPTLLIRSRSPQLFSEDESLILQQQLPYARTLSLPTTVPADEHHSDIAIKSILNFLNPISSSAPLLPYSKS